MTTPATASGPPMTVVAWAAIVAPLVGFALKSVSSGWLMLFILLWSPVLIIGCVLLVVAVARGMLRRDGVLRQGARRTRSIVWAWLTSVGVVLLGFAMIDGGDTRESVQSLLTMLLGSPVSPSAAHDVSDALATLGAVAWLVGWLALVLEWAIGASRRRPKAPRVAPPAVPQG
ncbi:hypothetical protein SAMN04487783_1542 [Agrococcus baldri]|uniref:Uncharacterized protein n=1 Tax=Agrococcus baldri TaxID=153730 RepID=A0AA94HMG7_9MICO|nr:hypothetical protein [Agrococcus baldri]SFS11245.1 hypothetical protein SAMN04487783_1542 [Agrococcus baldri]